MTVSPSSYLVLASQRSGSTLLVESLRATGVADESILRLLDPLDAGTPDLAPPEIWRDYIRTVGRTPNGVWGGKLMWNQTPLLLDRGRGLPGRARHRRRSAHSDGA